MTAMLRVIPHTPPQDGEKNIIDDDDYIKWRHFRAIRTARYLRDAFFSHLRHYDYIEFQARTEDADMPRG